jgi:hypothetical protein
MFHITDLNWIQLILIEIGVLLQLLAICAFVGEAYEDGRLRHPEFETEEASSEELDEQISREIARDMAEFEEEENFEEKTHPEIKAGQLTKTASVKFVQKFKFRLQDSR